MSGQSEDCRLAPREKMFQSGGLCCVCSRPSPNVCSIIIVIIKFATAGGPLGATVTGLATAGVDHKGNTVTGSATAGDIREGTTVTGPATAGVNTKGSTVAGHMGL